MLEGERLEAATGISEEGLGVAREMLMRSIGWVIFCCVLRDSLDEKDSLRKRKRRIKKG